MTSWYRTEDKGEVKMKSITGDTEVGMISVNQWGWHDIPSLQEKIEEPVEEIEATPLPPVKKPRGRPRKNAADKTSEKPKAKAKTGAKSRTKVQTEDMKTEDMKVDDPVEAPSHYCKGGYELGPILYVWGLSHRRASAVEYIMRAGDKKISDEVEDLRKAIRNLQMEIEYMEKYGQVR